MPRIWNFVPYCHREEGAPPGKDLGLVYNQYMALVPKGDWACFLDHDVALTTPYWFRLIEEAIAKEPEAGAFIPVTNRLSRKKSGWQMAEESSRNNDVMSYHRKIGKDRYEKYGCELQDVTHVDRHETWKPFSGFCFVVSKAVWEEFGGVRAHGMSGVDWSIHLAVRGIKRKVYLIKGFYVYHWFKLVRDLSWSATKSNKHTF